MNSDQVEKVIRNAIATLFVHQPDFWEFTSATNQTEWNIAHHLANELHSMLGQYQSDIDVSKPNLDSQRPDIIIHRRGRHRDNFLVIEVKRHARDVDDDIAKIHNSWFGPPLHYQFGAVVAIPDGGDAAGSLVRVFANPRQGGVDNAAGSGIETQ